MEQQLFQKIVNTLEIIHRFSILQIFEFYFFSFLKVHECVINQYEKIIVCL
jgi:hypothetical protein